MSEEAEKKGSTLPGAVEAPIEGAIENGFVSQADDTDLLAQLGYKQELRRQYSTTQVFAIAFSIMALLPSIASTLSFSLPAGPVGMVWVGLCQLIFTIMGILIQIREDCVRLTVSAEEFHTVTLALTQNPTDGFALMLLSLISIARDGEWSASRPVIYATYLATVVVHACMATFMGRIMNRIQSVCIVLNVGLVIATVIALPVGNKSNGLAINSGKYVFGHMENLTTWPTGWAFVLAWLSPIWTIGAFDSCVHMSEEATHATRAVPIGIILSIGLCGILGFLSLAVIAACMDTNLNNLIDSAFGQPMAQIYYDSLGKSGALGFMAVVAIVQFFMGLSILIAASRQTWAFSRDGALPFSSFFRHVSKRIQYQPVRTVWGVAFIAIVIGLLTLIDSAAANALFSLAVAGNDVAWGVPILCRLIWGDKTGKFRPGPFYTGVFSKPIAITAVVYLLFAIILCMFPTGGPDPTPDEMNYTIVINGAIWIGAALYYFLFARKWYTGPKTTTA
ncbi:hypothetical protein UA08_03242 [Talaromyces atroroseus]|uniref:GABA-specific permease n=1 Tax=Talaromyces atroroseus TaxID=1441469 RepID=A0A225AZ05_TALAT|nr:hypothetical protein UA08_03242 [Talaromyces atroroseus]OKL60949.1 hypothetical protein UA08_03242 [Talaromyces atroroseus]